MTLDLPLTPSRVAMLVVFSIATALLIPLELYLMGGICAALAALLIVRDDCRPLRRRMGVLLACVLLLSAAPIHTGTAPRHFLTLGLPILGCVLLPALILRRTDPGVIRYRWLPRRFRPLDMFYLAISAPLAWIVLRFYFGLNEFMPFQWPMPEEADHGAMTRLFWGINGVGVWDELFFVNTGFAILRSLFSLRIANLTQAVLYTAVLCDLAFVGIGPIVVYVFALTQGAMFEESENLLYVLVVHLIVDYFLYWQIVMGHYPAYIRMGFLH